MTRLLERPTLVLNRSWQPVHVSRVSRSLVLVWNDHAKIVDPRDFALYSWSDWSTLEPSHGEEFIQTTRWKLRIPEVIVLTGYDRVPRRTVSFSRRNLYRRDHFTCQYCGAQPGSSELTIDHVVPRSRGGKSTWENCVLACVDCNRRKADRSPEQCGLALKRRPVQPRWKPGYAAHGIKIASWDQFLSEVYWQVELEQ